MLPLASGRPWIWLPPAYCRGLSLGGEYGTSATYLSEMASPHHRGFYASFQYITLIAGQLFALLVQIVLQSFYTNAQLTAFGIRAIGALVIVSGYTSINAIVKAELFPSEIRALGVGLPYGLTVALFGGTVNYVALWLRSLHHESLFFWYVSLAATISLYAYVFLLKAHRSQFEGRKRS